MQNKSVMSAVYYLFVCLIGLNQLILHTEGYKTVVLVHGLNSGPGEFDNLKPRIEQAHPGTNVVALNYSPDTYSLDPIPVQLKWFERQINEVLSEINNDDVHLICHSQGQNSSFNQDLIIF